jgi:hypothetical protein
VAPGFDGTAARMCLPWNTGFGELCLTFVRLVSGSGPFNQAVASHYDISKQSNI